MTKTPPVHGDVTMRFPPLPDDGLALPDLRAWIVFFGGYDKIGPEAWEQWDRLHESHRTARRSTA
jgi:uncharacterized SAM-binding protein YcdF (DUF218 family)